MPKNVKRKLLFIHIPKTGGSTIERFFGMNNPGSLMSGANKHLIDDINFASQHLRARDLVPGGEGEYEDYFIFSFVRNPYTRVLSEYYYNKKPPEFNPDAFESWLTSFYSAPLNDHKLSQTDYIYDESGYTPVQWIGKLENIAEDVKSLCTVTNNLDLINNHLSHDRVGSRRPNEITQKILSPIHIELINNMFRDDFRNFNYEIKE